MPPEPRDPDKRKRKWISITVAPGLRGLEDPQGSSRRAWARARRIIEQPNPAQSVGRYQIY